MRTHYDTLRVAPDAPDEVIRAAYRALTQRHHPDRNPGDAGATRLMQALNDAYAVLSDPDRRREHDAWIARDQATRAARLRAFQAATTPAASDTTVHVDRAPPARRARAWHGGLIAVLLMLLGASAVALLWQPRPPAPAVAPRVEPIDGWSVRGLESDPAQARARRAVRAAVARIAQPAAAPVGEAWRSGSGVVWGGTPALSPPATPPDAVPLDPNGQPWPDSAGEVPGLRQDFLAGMTTVTVDNVANPWPVFVKLVALEAGAQPVRQVFLPAQAHYRIEGVRAGRYELHYRNLQSGETSRSDPFELRQFETPGAVRYSEVDITLYQVEGGTPKAQPLAADAF